MTSLGQCAPDWTRSRATRAAAVPHTVPAAATVKAVAAAVRPEGNDDLGLADEDLLVQPQLEGHHHRAGVRRPDRLDLLVIEYNPSGLFEKTGNIWRAQGHRARLDLKNYVRFITLKGEADDGANEEEEPEESERAGRGSRR